MRIGLVCPYTWEVPGGVQQHVADLARQLISLGHEVSILAPCDSGDLPPYVVSAGGAVPVPYNGSVARLAFGFRSAGRVRKWIREGDFDLLHVHEPTAPSLSLLACWIATGPIVATFHTCNPRSRAMAVSAAALGTALEKVSARIAVSEAARKTLVEHLGGDAVLVPNGVDVERFERSVSMDGWPGEDGAIGFLGRLDEPRKGLGVLLDAFGRLARERSGLRLLVAGPGDTSEAHDRVPEDLRDRVVLLGQVEEAGKARFYNSVDIFCAPNLGGESFGIVLTEAMSAGAAVLASDIPAFRHVLWDGAAGALFSAGDVDSLVRGAAILLDAPERRRALSGVAREAVRAYDWRTVAADVVRVYETVLLAGEERSVATVQREERE